MLSHRKLHIGLSLSATWLSGNGWRRKDSGAEHYFLSDFYVELARRAEFAKLDFVFKPDTLFLNEKMVGQAPGFSSLDPTILLTSIARETKQIGLVTTASTTYNPRMSWLVSFSHCNGSAMAGRVGIS